ncbi:hypothetical protein AB1L30_25855 [Bremerella sp. JC817]|uniref:hypothetical protein n=1 Tax=Bremerella sp. JC817 TaxID=3231756 RepID=UPI00345B0821
MKNIAQSLFVLLVCVTSLQGQEPLAAPYEGVLVLNNGNAMRGLITQEGEFYSLAINEDSIIRLPAERVAFACKSMEEAYLRQKARVGTTALRHHVELANWCLGLDMWEEATYHHEIALRSGPNHPDVVRLDRRYQVKLEERQNPNKVEQVHFTQPVARPEVDMHVEQASASEEMEPTLSPDVVRYYTSTVQPILLNSCSASLCHASNSENEFKLVQFENVRSIPRRMTIRNMNAVLDYINYDQPLQSKMVTHSSSRHGDGQSPNLSPEQFTSIRNWVVAVSRGPRPTRTAIDSSVMPASFNAPAETPKALMQPNQTPVKPLPSAPVNPIFGGNANASQGGLQRPFRSMPQKGAPVKEAPEVRDEFDPELFNRKYHPNREEQLFPG